MSRLVPVLDESEKALVIAHARSLLVAKNGGPVKFRHQGRTLKGVDCIGVIALSFAALGYEIHDRVDYGKLPAQRKLAAAMEEHFGPPVHVAPVTVEQLQPGDVIAMSWGEEEAHVALVVDHPEYRVGVVHAYKNSLRVIEHGVIQPFADKILGVYRP